MSKFTAALFVTAMLMGLTGTTRPAAAIEYPWCAQYSGEDGGGGRNCGFVSWEQCMATVRGMGGDCEPNLFYNGSNGPDGRHAKSTAKRRHDAGE